MNRSPISCLAPAKINLALHVTGQRADGYHTLESLVVFADMGDRISVTLSPEVATGEITCRFTGPFGSALQQALGGTTDHLVIKAAQYFSKQLEQLDHGLLIDIEKYLPVSSGIGGGSADAAATLLAIAELLGVKPDKSLETFAASLGADVPMCLHSQGLVARGAGTNLTLIAPLPGLHLLLVNPGIEISTPSVFRALHEKNNPSLEPLPAYTTQPTLVDWLRHQRNDLEPVAISLAPEIRHVLQALVDCGAQLSRMSGSGATCFGIFNSPQACKAGEMALRQRHPGWWVQSVHTTDHGMNRAATGLEQGKHDARN